MILNVNILAEGESFYQVAGLSLSTNHQMLAFAVDNQGRRIYTIHFKDLSTGEILSEKIEGVSSNMVWANDNLSLFYTSKNPQTLRTDKVFKHQLGTDSSKDQLVFFEEDEAYRTGIHKTKSKKFLLISSSSTLCTESRYLDAHQPEGTFTVILEREHKHEYHIDHYQDHWLIHTNKQASNFKLVKAPLDLPQEEHWEELIPHRKHTRLEDIDVFKDFLVLEERREGQNHIRIMSWDGKKDFYIPIKEAAYSAYPSRNPSFDSNILRFHYESLSTPDSVMSFNMETKEQRVLKQDEVLGDFHIGNYKEERIMATAKDGTKIPISVVYHINTRIDGSAPLVVYGYGSYGISLDPWFSSPRAKPVG